MPHATSQHGFHFLTKFSQQLGIWESFFPFNSRQIIAHLLLIERPYTPPSLVPVCKWTVLTSPSLVPVCRGTVPIVISPVLSHQDHGRMLLHSTSKDKKGRQTRPLSKANTNTYSCIYRECYKSNTRTFLWVILSKLRQWTPSKVA